MLRVVLLLLLLVKAVHPLRSQMKGFRLVRSSLSMATGPMRSINDREKKKYSDLAKLAAWGCSSLLIKPRPSYAVTNTVFPECSDSITVFRKGAREAVVIGTAHISDESAKLVERTIQKALPSIVMIELDPKRIGKFSNLTSLSEAGFDVPSFAVDSYAAASNAKLATRKPNLFEAVVGGIRQAFTQVAQGVSGAVLGRFLSQFYKSFEKLGFQTGGEFRAAVAEGKRLGARILLGDRDVDITLQRLSAAISGSDPDSFDRLLGKIQSMDVFESDTARTFENAQGDMDKEAISQFVESLKQRAGLRQMATTLKEEVPLVYEALIGERDAYMARAIATSGSSDSMLVGVVGMMHLDGIEKHLVADHGYQIVSTNCPRSVNDVMESNQWSPSRSFDNVIIS